MYFLTFMDSSKGGDTSLQSGNAPGISCTSFPTPLLCCPGVQALPGAKQVSQAYMCCLLISRPRVSLQRVAISPRQWISILNISKAKSRGKIEQIPTAQPLCRQGREKGGRPSLPSLMVLRARIPWVGARTHAALPHVQGAYSSSLEASTPAAQFTCAAKSITSSSSCHISKAHRTDVAFSRPLLPIKHKHTSVWRPTQATTQTKLTALSARS